MGVFDNIPVRINGTKFEASWWNDLRTALIAAFSGGGSGFVESSHSFTDNQAATDLSGETVNSANFKSAIYEFQIIRGTTVFANGRLYLQYLNSAWRLVESAYDGDSHGLTWSITGTTTAQLKVAADTGAGNGTIKFKKLLYAA